MKRSLLAAALAAPLCIAWIAGCGEDEQFASDAGDGAFEGGRTPDAAPVPTPGDDSGPPSACGDPTGAPPRLLLSMNSIGPASASSELAAYNLQTRNVDGRLGYAGAFGTTWSVGTEPYLLEQQKDIVVRLDAREPWKVVSSWNVAGDDKPDGAAYAYADPTAIAVPACGKGYVVRFKRNKIAVIDTAQKVAAGAPIKWIDLSPLVQAADQDGLVDATSALWVPSNKRLYVLLGNVDIKKVALDGYTALCASTKPSIVGIDVDKDEIVSLGGAGPMGSILLEGYNPVLGAFKYDGALDRLLVLEGGCNLEVDAGVAGSIARRRVEEVQLATGQVRTLLPLDTSGFPMGFVYADGTRAAVSFWGQAFFWNPQRTTLGAEIPGGVDSLTTDGKGNVLGARVSYLADGGRGPIEIVSVPFTDAGAIDGGAITKLGENPFTDNGGFIGGAEIWPRP